MSDGSSVPEAARTAVARAEKCQAGCVHDQENGLCTDHAKAHWWQDGGRRCNCLERDSHV